MSEQPASAKVCIACGTDCAGRPRVKDPHGRYMCRACADKRSPVTPSGASAADDAPLDLVPDLLDAPAIESVTPCPECGRPIAAGGTVCVSCGHNLATGKQLRIHKGTDKAPATTNPYKHHERLGVERADSAKEYIKPIVMFLIGAGIVAIWQGAQAENPAAGAAYLLRYAINVPIAVIVFATCCLIWIGFDAPLHLTALRIAGIYAICDLVQHTINQVPLAGIFAWVITIFVYIGLLSEMLDMDIQDAVVVALLTFLAKWVVKLTLFMMLFAQ